MPTKEGQQSIYKMVTSSIIRHLERGVVPWKQPWISGQPRNLLTGNVYKGVNPWILTASASEQEFTSRHWLGFNQAKKLGGHVRKGEASTLIIFFKPVEKLVENEDGEQEKKTIPILQYHRVFNIQQIEGISDPDSDQITNHDPLPAAEQIVEGMPNRPPIKTGNPPPCYDPNTDEVKLPPRSQFLSGEGFFETAFHELAHSTSHPTRLNRQNVGKARFGGQDYAHEELIAELSASYLCGVAGILPQTVENEAAYIASWLQALRADSRLIVRASSAAQRAADFILGETQADAE